MTLEIFVEVLRDSGYFYVSPPNAVVRTRVIHISNAISVAMSTTGVRDRLGDFNGESFAAVNSRSLSSREKFQEDPLLRSIKKYEEARRV